MASFPSLRKQLLSSFPCRKNVSPLPKTPPLVISTLCPLTSSSISTNAKLSMFCATEYSEPTTPNVKSWSSRTVAQCDVIRFAVDRLSESSGVPFLIASYTSCGTRISGCLLTLKSAFISVIASLAVIGSSHTLPKRRYTGSLAPVSVNFTSTD